MSSTSVDIHVLFLSWPLTHLLEIESMSKHLLVQKGYRCAWRHRRGGRLISSFPTETAMPVLAEQWKAGRVEVI